MPQIFRERRDLIYRLISEGGSLKVRKPEGAFYIFPEFEGPADSETVSLELLDKEGVVVTPGSAFLITQQLLFLQPLQYTLL